MTESTTPRKPTPKTKKYLALLGLYGITMALVLTYF